MPGLKDRNEMTTVGKQAAATTPAECAERAAEALAYAEECFLIGALKKASGLMALSRSYLALAKAMEAQEADADG